MDYPVSLYFASEGLDIQVMDLCRGNDDFRKVYIVNDGRRKLVIKHLSNTFSDRRRIEGWFQLMDAYRGLGIYCPRVVPSLDGTLLHSNTADGRTYYVYAEEYAVYETAEHIGEAHDRAADGRCAYRPDVMRSLGKVAAAHLDLLDWPSSYCLLTPFCSPDTTDEATECAELFTQYVRDNLPRHLPRAETLLKMFYQRQKELRKVYDSLPCSCFQGDLNDSNILLDENNAFAGLIDFNLCGREPVLNYAVREALWGVSDSCLFDDNDSRLYFYDKALEELRIRSFLENMRYIQEYYTFSEAERDAFPLLFRYMNSYWWFHINEIRMIREDEGKINQLFDWLEFQMTRDDLRLP